MSLVVFLLKRQSGTCISYSYFFLILCVFSSEAAVENMTEEERDFHYFTVHDYDKNNFLDGLEVRQLSCRQFPELSFEI